jgi:cellulose synthase/poly-beta-1,6-N-acetylglucosamine synthase-like glycosyltransferase
VTLLAPAVIGAALAWWAYAYAGYPLALAILVRVRRRMSPATTPRDWPQITICIAAHNEAASIADTIERTLALDYPADRRHILVISDGSTDDTDGIVGRYASRGVELLCIEKRGGKTAGENQAIGRLRGSIIVNTDATVFVDQFAIKPLVRAFDDPDVGVASGRDISVAPRAPSGRVERTRSESAYVGYEMWVRSLETRVGGIVGASGCLYAARAVVQRTHLPGGVARDFAAPLIARDLGLRAVSVNEAVCRVPRSTDLAREFQRKRRTITRGIATLARFRHLLNPRRTGLFAWKLASHKVVRWLAPVWAMAAGAALVAMAFRLGLAVPVTVALGVVALVTIIGSRGGSGRLSRACASVAFGVVGNLAVVSAWISFLRGVNPPVWEPTRRTTGPAPTR